MKEIYDTYLEVQFARVNELSEKQYKGAAKSYEAMYGRFMPANKSSKILDIGCGAGHFLYYLKKEGYTNYRGIDISKQQVDFVKQNITENVELADAFEFLEGKEKLCDLIVVNDLLEHIPKDMIIKFLKLIYSSLKNDGIVMIKTLNMVNPFALRSRYMDITHEIGFTEHSLYEVLKVSGFEDISIYPIPMKIRSIKSLIGRFSQISIQRTLKILYFLQGIPVPEIMTVMFFAVVKK